MGCTGTLSSTSAGASRASWRRSGRARSGSAPWDELALAAGFSDQAHLVRECTAITGVTPTAYLRARPEAAHHVGILQDGR
ncbi:MAG: AraC family transcriptional regulator [Vicinamibacterales bacterium]